MKPFSPKKPSKDEREKLILIGLVELYLKTGKPVLSTPAIADGVLYVGSQDGKLYAVE